VIPTNTRLPQRIRVRTQPSKHIRRSNRLTSLALIILVIGTVATAGVHFLSPSNASPGPHRSGSADVTAPAVAFTAPTSGSVSGVVTVAVAATDETGGSGVASVAVTVDGADTPIKGFTGNDAYDFSWDTSTLAHGSHTLSAVATDKAGNAGTALLTVTIN
jgi:hypothetical protein